MSGTPLRVHEGRPGAIWADSGRDLPRLGPPQEVDPRQLGYSPEARLLLIDELGLVVLDRAGVDQESDGRADLVVGNVLARRRGTG